ncbi:MAG: class I fructose-bisphosphate aldolase [Pseudomonadota bacterium]
MADTLHDIAQKMVRRGQGILAADESTGTIKKRFDSIGVTSTPEMRRDYREMLFTADEAMNDYISGVILYEETLMQDAKDGTPLVDLLTKNDALIGIKVDKGAKPLALGGTEKVTEGLDGLRERLAAYHDRGARFAKWRAVVDICEQRPTRGALRANAHALARYAALCQEAGIVPIVEPEVVADGDTATHSIDRCYDVTDMALKALYEELADAGVDLEGTILKPNMVVPGIHGPKASVEEVAEKTIKVLKANVPTSVPGIAFLSGGQTDEQATAHLSAMNAISDLPWTVTFSYGRALQAAALQAWGGRSENVAAAQRAFTHRARMNGLAAMGGWNNELEIAA